MAHENRSEIWISRVTVDDTTTVHEIDSPDGWYLNTVIVPGDGLTTQGTLTIKAPGLAGYAILTLAATKANQLKHYTMAQTVSDKVGADIAGTTVPLQIFSGGLTVQGGGTITSSSEEIIFIFTKDKPWC